MIVVAFSGSRRATWENQGGVVRREIDALVDEVGKDRLAIVHGDADGIDSIVNAVCVYQLVQVLRCPAPWKLRGQGAGPFRNGFMLDYVKVSRAVALPCAASVGTRGFISMCERRGIPCRVVELGDL
jgi:hypothetical protein